MANISMSVDGKSVPVPPTCVADLGKTADDLNFIFDGSLKGFLAGPLSAVPKNTSGSVALDAGNPCWKLDGSPATFSLKAKTQGSVSIVAPGQSLFQYSPDVENSGGDPVKVQGRPDACYVVMALQFNISGDLSAKVPVGAVGVTTDAGGSVAYTVKNYKPFDPQTTVQDALLAAIGGFTLPLHQNTLANLQDEECIYYEFDGAMNVGFGATVGLSGQVGGSALAQMGDALSKGGGLVSTPGLKPMNASLNASLSAKFNWTRNFQCFLERKKPNAAKMGGAVLHICAGRDSQRAIQLQIDAGISPLGDPKLCVDSKQMTQWVSQTVQSSTGVPIPAPLLSAASGEMQKYVGDSNKWLAGLFQKVTDAGITLALYYQSESKFTSAFTWNFDFENAQAQMAWDAAMAGDFLKALATGAVTLDPGSGYEQMHFRETGVKLTIFGLWKEASLEKYFDSASVSYQSDGHFHLQGQAGQVVTTANNAKTTSTTVYLSATGTGASNDAGTQINATGMQIQLHGILDSTGESKQATRLTKLLQALGGEVPAATGQALVSMGKLFQKLGTKPSLDVHLIYEMSALSRLLSDEYVNGKQAAPPHIEDEDNWIAYSQASDAVDSDPVDFLSRQMTLAEDIYSTYDDWRKFNCLLNQFTDGEPNPTPLLDKADRTSWAPYSPAIIRQGFGEMLTDEQANMMKVYFAAGQQYMNLCGDIQETIQELTPVASVEWGVFFAKLQAIAAADIDAWFGPVVMLAMAASCRCEAATVTGMKIIPASAGGSTTISLK